MNTISITNMGSELSEEDVREYFYLFGPLKDVRCLTDKDTGRSRGFAFVTFSDSFSFAKCVNHAAHELRGKRVQVSSVDEPVPCTSAIETPSKKLFVSFAGIPDVDDAVLQELFSTYGTVVNVDIRKDTDDSPLFYGIITFTDEESVNRCLSVPVSLHKQPLFIRRAIRKEEVKKAEQRERERTERMERIMANPQASARYFASVPSLLGGGVPNFSNTQPVFYSGSGSAIPDSMRTRSQRDDAYNQVSFQQNYQYNVSAVGTSNPSYMNHSTKR